MEKEKEYKKDLDKLSVRMENVKKCVRSLINELNGAEAIRSRMLRNATPEYDWRKDPKLSVNEGAKLKTLSDQEVEEQMELDNEEELRQEQFDYEYDQYKDNVAEEQFNENSK